MAVPSDCATQALGWMDETPIAIVSFVLGYLVIRAFRIYQATARVPLNKRSAPSTAKASSAFLLEPRTCPRDEGDFCARGSHRPHEFGQPQLASRQ
mmetsp:Transcript_89092/g.191173  ORF Transcript_89092/g.191173 Transcript_89092/m.191173 type:complete len:96 (+) Transcript_89092:223-510(+)